MMSHHLVVMSLLVLIVGQVIKELVVELSRFSNELSLWDGQHQSVHFFLKPSVLVEHECCTQNIALTEIPIAIATEFPCTPARLVTVDMALPVINLGSPVSLSRITDSLSLNFN